MQSGRVISIKKYYSINEKIRAKELRVISDEGENLGVLPTQEALKLAREKELDLVLIAPAINPPVAKILEFNKFLYEERKKKSAAKTKSKKSELKELRFGPTTDEGDVSRLIYRAKEFIEDGNRVKISVVLRGRENLYPEIGFEKIKRVESDLSQIAKTESEPKKMGNTISMVFVRK